MFTVNMALFSAIGITIVVWVLQEWFGRRYRVAELCAKASLDLGMNILLFGGPEEQALNEQISTMILNGHPTARIEIVQASSLTKSLAIMNHCKAFISNDSGLMHCAAALQLPMIAIFGYTNHVHTAPWNNPNAVIARI